MLKLLQLVQTNAARLVFRKYKNEHVNDMLKQLHWLPVKLRLVYKINLITFKAFHGLATQYISDLLEVKHSVRNLRLGNCMLLKLKQSGDRAFSVCA